MSGDKNKGKSAPVVTPTLSVPVEETKTIALPHGTTVSGGRYVVNGVLVDAHGQAIIIKD